MTTATSTRTLDQQRRGRRGQQTGPLVRRHHPDAPGGRVGGVAAPSLFLQPLGRGCSIQAPAPSKGRVPSVRPVAGPRSTAARPVVVEAGLTERGLKLVIGTFGALMVIAVVVIVAQFFAVSNAPLAPTGVAAAQR